MTDTVLAGFGILELAGYQPGRAVARGDIPQAAEVYARVLADLTPQEAEEAFRTWVQDPPRDHYGDLPRFFPPAAHIRSVVPHLEESEREWQQLKRGKGSITARLVDATVGLHHDGVSFKRAFREYRRRWEALPMEERSTILEGKVIRNPLLLAEPLLRPALEER